MRYSALPDVLRRRAQAVPQRVAPDGLSGGFDPKYSGGMTSSKVWIAVLVLMVLIMAGVVTFLVVAVKSSPPSAAPHAVTPVSTTVAAAATTTAEVIPLVIAPPAPAPAPPRLWDEIERQVTVEPRDEPRWPLGTGGATEYGWYGADHYGRGGSEYPVGHLAGLWARGAEYDYPTAGIMRRPHDPVGPWERVGAVVNGDGSKVLPLFVRQHGRGSWNKYDYRVAVDKVPIEVNDSSGRGVDWINQGDAVAVPGLGDFSAQIYGQFK